MVVTIDHDNPMSGRTTPDQSVRLELGSDGCLILGDNGLIYDMDGGVQLTSSICPCLDSCLPSTSMCVDLSPLLLTGSDYLQRKSAKLRRLRIIMFCGLNWRS